jgi:hypothetical protein
LEVEVAKIQRRHALYWSFQTPELARCANVARSPAPLPLITALPPDTFIYGSVQTARANCLEHFVKISCNAYLETQYRYKTKRPDLFEAFR